MERAKKISVSEHLMGENDMLSRALGVLIWHAMKGGVTQPGESCTLMVPDILVGPSLEEAFPTGEWEIKMTKIGD